MKNRLTTVFAAGLTALMLLGCESKLSEEYHSPKENPKQKITKETPISTLGGVISDVQPHSIPVTQQNYPITFVLVTDENEKEHILIYPYAAAFFKGRSAVVRYRQVNGGISSKEFIKSVYGSGADVLVDNYIRAEGIIVSAGVEYR